MKVAQIVGGNADYLLQLLQLLQLLPRGDNDLWLGRLPQQVAGTPLFDGLAQRVMYESSLSAVA